ncbi:excalibur calcium-binding domain-containing protein [Actinomycetospora sp. CA-101289]|uniref:excalibur calcium-binding domain-containing protein n=1 Tax=Actinomycetospora sp. CA-101289 TaxID=3239893 RepID=UPI003D96A20D
MTGRTTTSLGRLAAVAAGAVLLAGAWTGAALADEDPTGTAPAPAAPSAECQQLTGQLATAQQALTDALGALGGAAAQDTVEQLTARVAEACAATAPALTGTGLPAPAAAGLAPGATAASGDLDCPDFGSQAEAQAYFTSIGGSAARNADRLDRNRNGVACEDYPYATTAPAGSLPAGGFGQVSAVPSGGIETGGSDTPAAP